MIAEQTTCIVRFAERSAGLNAKGQSAAALKAMWQMKRSQGRLHDQNGLNRDQVFRRGVEESKTDRGSIISSMAFRFWRGSVMGADGNRRGVINGVYLPQSLPKRHSPLRSPCIRRRTAWLTFVPCAPSACAANSG
jgi:hypothetical protein